jgi:GxxExxY protein
MERLQESLATQASSGTFELVHKELAREIVGAAIEVHRHLGPGQLERVYQAALEHELELRAMPFRRQVPVPMLYKGKAVGEFFLDLVVDGKVIVEVKAVERYSPLFTAQVISYLRATKLRLGLLINFNAPVLWRGVRRIVV